MKLLICLACSDVLSLRTDQPKACACGKTGGRYVDDINAEFWGECAPVGFANGSLLQALTRRDDLAPGGMGADFAAFVIPEPCPTMTRIAKPDEALPEIKGRRYTKLDREKMRMAFLEAVESSKGRAREEMIRLRIIFEGLCDDADQADDIIKDMLRDRTRAIMEKGR